MKQRALLFLLDRIPAVGLLALLSWNLAFAAAQVYPTVKLDVPRTMDDIELYESLGFSVSATEHTAWLGEPGDDVIIGNEGTVFGFERARNGWALSYNLAPSDVHTSQTFGTGHSFGTDWGIVGSPRHSGERKNSGAFYSIHRSGSSWLEVQRVHQPNPHRFEFFGANVALSGNRAVAGSTGYQEAGQIKGAGYVYVRSQGTWSLEAKLVPDHSPPQWTNASRSLDLHGDVAVLGAAGGDKAMFQGIVFVFERTPSGWIQTAVLEDPTPQDDDEFGRYAVAVQGDTILVGEAVPKFFSGGYRPGSVFVFERVGPPPGGWTLVQELQASNKSVNQHTGDHFGYSLDVHGDRFLTGALYGKVGDEVRGTAYLFERGPNGWGEIAMLAHDNPVASNYSNYGVSVALSSSFALVGAHTGEGSVPGIQSGCAYVYELPFGDPYCAAVPNSTGAPATIHATGSLAAGAGALELWAGSLPPHKTGLFLVSPDAGFVPNPGGSQGNLCLGGPIGRFQSSVQSTGPRGTMHHVVDTGVVPPNPPSAIQPGETWRFQAWHRDQNPADTSNLTPGLEVAFR